MRNTRHPYASAAPRCMESGVENPYCALIKVALSNASRVSGAISSILVSKKLSKYHSTLILPSLTGRMRHSKIVRALATRISPSIGRRESRSGCARYSSISCKSGDIIKSASVAACTSSAVHPGAISRSTKPSAVISITAMSVTIRSTQPLPVSG